MYKFVFEMSLNLFFVVFDVSLLPYIMNQENQNKTKIKQTNKQTRKQNKTKQKLRTKQCFN